MKLFVLAALLAYAFGQDCPAWGDWREQTDCLWFPLKKMRQDFVDACGIDFDVDTLPTPPPLPGDILEQINQNDKCGHCSFKMQCRKRTFADMCFPLEAKHERCNEHGDVCVMPKIPKFNNCKWNYFIAMLKQCINRPEADMPEWKRDEFKKWGAMLPDSNCVEKDGKCHCCCHPYKPSRDGTTCQEAIDLGCEEWGEPTPWSDCLWGMPQKIIGDFKSHCGIDVKAGSEVTGGINLPDGFDMPDKCGYCSFKVRCQKRSKTDKGGKNRCFSVKPDKRACGPEDCETCGTPCSLPKIRESCDYGAHLRKLLKSRMKKIEKMPYHRRRGLQSIAQYLPHGKCVEVDGKCKCCCHPYEPTADGSACELKGYCKTPSDLGHNIFGEASTFFL